MADETLFFNIRVVWLSGEVFKEFTLPGSAQVREVMESVSDAEPMARLPQLLFGARPLSENLTLCSLELPHPPEWAEMQIVRDGRTHTFDDLQLKVDAGYDDTVKVMLVGNKGVGKSSLALRFTQGSWVAAHECTIGDVSKVFLVDNSLRLNVLLWDFMGGIETFRTVSHAGYCGADVFLVVFDLTERNSLGQVALWLQMVRTYSKDRGDAVIALVGSKVDLADHRRISFEEAWEFAFSKNLPYFETSAKDDICVSDAFFEVMGKALDGRPAYSPRRRQASLSPVPSPSRCMCVVA